MAKAKKKLAVLFVTSLILARLIFILESSEGCMEVECNIHRKGKIPI